MRILGNTFALLAHLQVVMALSAVAFVQTATMLIGGRGASALWLIAAGLGTLGIYLLDGVRSAECEDSISQPARSSLSRRFRASATLIGVGCVLVAGICGLLTGLSLFALVLLVILGLLGCAHLLPVLPGRHGRVTVKDQGVLKPFAISIAWLLGASLVAVESIAPDARVDSVAVLGFWLSALPLLLLDSIWLDRRDMSADAAFERATVVAKMSAARFQWLRIVLFLLALVGAPFLPGGVVMVGWLMLGAVCLVVLEPSRLHSEAGRVWLAALWRFTGLLGAVTIV